MTRPNWKWLDRKEVAVAIIVLNLIVYAVLIFQYGYQRGFRAAAAAITEAIAQTEPEAKK